MLLPFFNRHFSSEKCPTITVASFFHFFVFSLDQRAHPVCTTFNTDFKTALEGTSGRGFQSPFQPDTFREFAKPDETER